MCIRDSVDPDRVLFVRRIVTRAADSAAEEHDTMSPHDFAEAETAGAFAPVSYTHLDVYKRQAF